MYHDAAVSYGQLYSWREVQTYPADWMHEANLGTSLSLRGQSLETVLSCLRRLVESNEVLRTTYHLEAGVPMQRIHTDPPLPIARVDRPVLDRDDVERAKEALMGVAIPMTDSLGWRGVLVTTDGEPQFLALSFSHLIVDVWSIRHLQNQLQALATGADVPRGPSPRELARWQREGAVSGQHHGADRYWKRILAAEPMRQPPTLASGGTRHRIQATLHSRRLGGLAALAAGRHGVTVPAVLMSLAAAGLSRHLDSDRVTMSLMASNRFAPELQHAVGTLNQLIPVTVDVDKAATVGEHVKQVHWAAARAYRYSSYDFDRVVALAGAAEPDGDCWFNHLFRCWFNYLQFDSTTADPADQTPARLEWTPLARQYGQPFDVRVSVRDGLTSLALRVDPDVIPAEVLTDILHTIALGTQLAAIEPVTSVKDLWSTRARPLPTALFPLTAD